MGSLTSRVAKERSWRTMARWGVGSFCKTEAGGWRLEAGGVFRVGLFCKIEAVGGWRGGRGGRARAGARGSQGVFGQRGVGGTMGAEFVDEGVEAAEAVGGGGSRA